MNAALAPPSIVLVAALDRNRAIGAAGTLPWRLPADLRRFRERTTGGVVLMGRRTAESLPSALPHRRNLVLTRGGEAPHADMTTVGTLEEALAAARPAPLLVIGGGEVYALALPHATQMWLTHVDMAVSGADTWFPEIDFAEWREGGRESHPPDDRHSAEFSFVDYRRRGVPASVTSV